MSESISSITNHEPSPLKWACNRCTYYNYPKTKKCTMCGEGRVTRPLIIDIHSNDSQDIYKMSSLIVDTCESSVEKNLANVNSSKWSCHMCTYLNYPRATKCTQCDTTRTRVSRNGNSPCRSSSPSSMSSPSSLQSNETTHVQEQTANFQQDQEQHSQSQHASHTRTSSTRTQTNTSSSDNYHNDRNRVGTLALHYGLKWCCSACTYENWEAAKKCIICGTQRRASRRETENENEKNALIDERRKNTPSPPVGATGKCNLTTMQCNNKNNKKESHESVTSESHAYLDERCNDLYGMVLIPNSSRPIAKRVPSDVSRYLASEIRRHISNGLRQRKGEFACYFVNEFVTFTLPAEVEDLSPSIQERLFAEILDRDVQKELEEESTIINWSLELTERYGSRLYALWNRSTGDCLLDSVLQATWGVFDRENILRKSLSDSLIDATSVLFPRFKEAETLQANLLHFTLDDDQWQEDWAVILSLANQPGQSLEQIHIFTLAHILRRPIIVYAIKIVKSFRGETLGYAGYEGIYLPLLWEHTFCWKSPIALGYTRGHFTALVAIEPDSDAHIGAGANLRTSDDSEVILLPLVTSEHQLLPIHFLRQSEIGREEEIMRQYVDCCMTAGGILVAQQKIPKKPLLVAQMMEEWMDFYRNLTLTASSLPHNVLISDNTVQDFSSDADSDQE